MRRVASWWRAVCAMANVNALRAEVARAQKLAGNKITRTLKSTGAKIAGSDYDPRRDSARVAKYNTKQLTSYLSELNDFRDRNLQFVSGARGTPIPAHLARRFESVQASYNKRAAQEFDVRENIKMQGGQTIGVREGELQPESRRYSARAYNRPLGRANFDISGVTSAEALNTLEQNMRKRLTDTHSRNTISAQRFQMGEIMDRLGEDALKDAYMKLDDSQFNTLWNYTDFAETLSQRYESVKNMSVTEETRTGNDFRAELVDTLDWARGIKIDQEEVKPAKKANPIRRRL